uniref:Uncharacterized protein n=1 Tax=Alexandrium catenella TaxID=2925 RepID=A0A7S1PZ77_ALECA|mmetsp:Transcript_117541/g.312682  ORF Transcript_117541/g.312682 Transcript_117541/m.312682 type:complete len:218 (+) Transcript_117541:92-745(+)
MAACVFHCLDLKIAQEWLKTCKEYSGYIVKPFQSKRLPELLKSYQRSSLSDHQMAYKEWGVIQFWVGILAAIVIFITELFGNDSNNAASRSASFVVQMTLRIILAYVFAHLSWFAVVQKKGCFCCLIACCECQPVLLVWGVLAIVWGLTSLIGALIFVGHCPLCFIGAAFAAVHAVVLTYLGVNCLHIWQLSGAEIVPPAIEVKGPEGEIVGSAQVV